MAAHPVLHVLHDAGLAAWTGGSLMGAVGLNGAAATLDDPRARSRVATTGWSRWAPVQGASLAAHLVGATGLLYTDLPRVRRQQGVGLSSAVKTVTTGAMVGVGAWSAALNRKMAASTPVPVAGATEPSAATPPDVAKTQRQLKLVQWLNPLIGMALIAVTDWQEEQMRPTEQAKGRLAQLTTGRTPWVAGATAVGLGLLAARSRTSSKPQQTAADDLVAVDLVEVDVIDLGTTDSRDIADLPLDTPAVVDGRAPGSPA